MRCTVLPLQRLGVGPGPGLETPTILLSNVLLEFRAKARFEIASQHASSMALEDRRGCYPAHQGLLYFDGIGIGLGSQDQCLGDGLHNYADYKLVRGWHRNLA